MAIALLALVALVIFVVLPAIQRRAANDTASADKDDAAPCGIEDYISETDGLITEWDDAEELASSTARIALSGPIATLQQIRRDTAAITPPDCANEMHEALEHYMQLTIDAYLSFMANEGDEATAAKIEDSIDAREQYINLRVVLMRDYGD